MEVHHVADVASLFSGVDEFAREFDTELDVVRAAAPFPVGSRRSALAVIASARLDGTFGAGSRDRVRHCGRHQGVDEGSFTASCVEKKKGKIFQLRETRINNRITIGLLTEWPFWPGGKDNKRG